MKDHVEWTDRWKVTGQSLAEIKREEFRRADGAGIFSL